MRISCRSNVRENADASYVSLRPASWLSRSASCAIFFMLMAVAAPAQIRLHDAANDDLAKKTRDAFAEFSKGDANVFETMIANTMALKEATLAQLYDLNRQSVQDLINIIPVLTWDELAKDVAKRQKLFLVAYNSAETILAASGKNPRGVKSAEDSATALKAAKEELAKLTKEKAAKEAELSDKDKKVGEAPDLEKLKKSLQDLRDAVAASTKPVKNLSDLTQFRSLKDVWTNINGVKEWFDAAEKASKAPGLQLTILDLGVQHQEIRVARLQLDLDEVKATLQIAERIEKRLEVVWGEDGSFDRDTGHLNKGLYGQIWASILPCAPRTDCPTPCAPRSVEDSNTKCLPLVTDQNRSQQVLQTMGALAKVANKEVGTSLPATMQLRDLIDVLGRYVSLTGYHQYLLLADAIEAGANKHLFSIRRSALNTRDREMLVSHGLDGLAAYYAGGLKPEEIANFFRAAQSIGVAVIAGRVK